jgi:hypothetical protein
MCDVKYEFSMKISEKAMSQKTNVKRTDYYGK